jgi:hypothetical protein
MAIHKYKFSVVEFEDKSIAAVPTTWLEGSKNNLKCRWGHGPDVVRLIQDSTSKPGKNWKT